MKFELNEKEVKNLEDFKTKCYDLFDSYAKDLTFSYEFFPTEVGTIIVAKFCCSLLNKPLECNITDITSW